MSSQMIEQICQYFCFESLKYNCRRKLAFISFKLNIEFILVKKANIPMIFIGIITIINIAVIIATGCLQSSSNFLSVNTIASPNVVVTVAVVTP